MLITVHDVTVAYLRALILKQRQVQLEKSGIRETPVQAMERVDAVAEASLTEMQFLGKDVK